MRPFTTSEPKPMIPIANRPILEYAIEALAKNRITDITIVVGYKKERIMTHFQDGKSLGVKLWNVSQLIDEGKLTMLIDADAPKGWAWRWLLLRSEVEALAAARPPKRRGRP